MRLSAKTLLIPEHARPVAVNMQKPVFAGVGRKRHFGEINS